jgi:hypothetical protein
MLALMLVATAALLFASAAHASTMRVRAGSSAQHAASQVIAHYRRSPVAYADGRLKLVPKPHGRAPIAYADGTLTVGHPHRRALAHTR